jgi:hypothetical protein
MINTRIALALVLAAAACKGKDAAPATKEQPAAKPEEKPADKPADPAVAKPADPAAMDPAARELAAKLTLKDPAICIGFTAGGKGAYFVTTSMDAGANTLELVAVGDATNPKLDSVTLQPGDDAAEQKARDAFAGKITAAIGKQQLSSCSEWQKKGESVTAQVAGKDVTLSAKGTKLKISMKGGATVEKSVEGGAENAYVDSAYSSSDFNTVAVVVNSTAEAMSNYDVYFIAATDLAKK